MQIFSSFLYLKSFFFVSSKYVNLL